MTATGTRFPLRRLRLRPGEQHLDTLPVELEPFDLGGERYFAVPHAPLATLTVMRATSGLVFDLAFDVRLHGPCMRCLDDAEVAISIAAREYQADAPGGDEELRSEYVVDDHVALSDWARDAIALALPDQILCRPDCAGICAVCGRNLNAEPHQHEEERSDPRWAALEQLRTPPED